MENNDTVETLYAMTTSNLSEITTMTTNKSMEASTLGIAENSSVQQFLDSFHSNITAATTAEGPSIEDFVKYKIGVALWKYMTLVVIILGLIGNVLSFLVMRFTSMNKTTSSIYLAALAIFDTGVLLVGLGRQWSRNMFQFDIRDVHEWTCKIHVFFTYAFTDLSAWMLICVTVERVILVYLPLRAKSICTKRNTKIVISLVILFIVEVNCHWMFTVGQRNVVRLFEETQENCAFLEGFEEFHRSCWPWIDASVFSFIPFTILLVCNILITVKLVKAATRRKKQMNVSSSKTDDATRSMTIILVMISLLFLCFTSPVVLLDVVIQPDLTRSPTIAERASEKLTVAIVNLLMYMNSALNFFMYCLSGKKFRRSLRELVCRIKTSHNTLMNTPSTTSQRETKTQPSRTSDLSDSGNGRIQTISDSPGETKKNREPMGN